MGVLGSEFITSNQWRVALETEIGVRLPLPLSKYVNPLLETGWVQKRGEKLGTEYRRVADLINKEIPNL